MKLGLLGFPVAHSKSPELYRKFLGSKLTSYELFGCEKPSDIPPLSEFMEKLDGLNITSPYKTHFFNQVIIESQLVQKLGSINTIGFSNSKAYGTNTDLVAVVEILKNYKAQFGDIEIKLLGDGVMAALTKIVATDLKIPLQQYSRKLTPDFANLDFRKQNTSSQIIIINSCSRDFVFNGQVSGDEIFWDYNYSFLPHQNTLPSRVKTYHDGQEMLELQAKAALNFWNELNSKLN